MLGRAFASLSRRVAIWIEEWNKNSVTRKHLSYPAREQVLRWASEEPGRFLLFVWFVIVLLTVAWGWAVPNYLGICLVPLNWKEPELLTYFSALWAIQATIAALVYPIVIAFVAVLLQRRATAKLSLRLYALDAAVAPAGSSAVALLTWMGLQYTFIPYGSIAWIAAAMAGNCLWFVVNLLLTGWFLYRTVRFLDDDARLEVFKLFAVQVAFLREAQGHLAGLIFSNAQARHLIPGGEYASDDPGPKVLLYPMSHGEPCITVFLANPKVIADIRLRLLRWGIALWVRRAKHAETHSMIVEPGTQAPLLQVAIVPGQVVEGNVVLCRVQHGPPPGAFAAFLIRHSVVFGPPPTPTVSYSTSEILEELAVEAVELAERKRFEAASEAMVSLTELHIALILSGAFVNESGDQDNAALLPDPYGFASQAIHTRWLKAYRLPAEIAVRNLTVDSTLWRRHCYLACGLIDSLRDVHLDILTHTLHISTYLMYRLGIWWSEKIEERGLIKHDALEAAELLPPLSATYDRALQDFIGGWEAIRFWHPSEEAPSAAEAWEAHRRQVCFVAAQLEETVDMLLNAVFRGDKAGTLWFADSFLKWWSGLEHRFDGNGLDESANLLLTMACVRKDWFEVRGLLDAIPEGAQEIEAAKEVAATILRRYWTDLRLVVICILLDWTPATAPPDTFIVDLATALLQSRNLKHGCSINADALTNPPFVLFRFLRLQLAELEYAYMLDRVVERAQDLRKPTMVSGRIYGSSGREDVESLCLAQIEVLSVITAAAMGLSPEVNAVAHTWSRDLQKLQQFKRLALLLMERANSDAFHNRLSITTGIRRAIGLPDNIDQSRGWLVALLKDLASLADHTHDETLKDAVVSQARLDKLGMIVSEYVLGKVNKVFPFSLTPEVQAVSYIGKPGTLRISGVNKAAYTDPPLEVESPAITNSFGEYVAEAIARRIVADYLETHSITPIRDDSAFAFFEDFAMRVRTLRNQRYSPLLLLSRSGAPEWTRPWRYHMRSDQQQHNLSVRQRRPDDPPSVIAIFDDIPVHQLWLVGPHCYVVANEHFNTLIYEDRGGGSCVSVSHTSQENHLIQIEFDWAFSAAAVHPQH